MPKNGIIQWGWTELEELLQCPVCLDIPGQGVVEQCRHGHHICANCKKQVDTCPLCKCDFHGTRNFVVEELVRHFEVLKNTMMLNNMLSEKKTKKKPKTKPSTAASVVVPNRVTRQVNTPNATRGVYPCRVADCDVLLPGARLLNHVRTYHGDLLTESIVDYTDSFSHTWEIALKNKKPINTNSFVIFVRGIGLIFLTIEILRSGQLVVVVQLATKFNHAQNFVACIEFFNDSRSYCYYTRLVSVKDNMESMMNHKMCFTLDKYQLKTICSNRKFKCKIRLSRFNEMDILRLTIPDIKQINVIMALRASLMQEEKDKKLLKQIEVCGNSNTVCTMNVVGNRPSTSNRLPVAQQQAQAFGYQFESLESALKILSERIQKQESALYGNGNGSREPQTRSEPVAGRRRNNRNRKNRRGMLNGTGPEL